MRFSWLAHFCAWLDGTELSQFIQGAGWIIPTVQTVHILAIAALLGSQTMILGRVLGLTGREQSPDRFAAQFLPFIWWPLLVLLLTGMVMIIGEPARELANPVFQLKMLLLIAAILVVRAIAARLKQPGGAEAAASAPHSARALAVLGLLLWVGIIFAGRWIAYI
jgi:hypothetical protein